MFHHIIGYHKEGRELFCVLFGDRIRRKGHEISKGKIQTWLQEVS